MAMNVKEKLVELLTDNLPRRGNLPRCDNPLQLSCDEQVQRIADHLIMNGVTVQETARRCVDGKPATNADRIRAMTDEELALWICGVYDIEEENGKFINGIIIPGYAPHDIEEWLQQPCGGE